MAKSFLQFQAWHNMPRASMYISHDDYMDALAKYIDAEKSMVQHLKCLYEETGKINGARPDWFVCGKNIKYVTIPQSIELPQSHEDYFERCVLPVLNILAGNLLQNNAKPERMALFEHSMLPEDIIAVQFVRNLIKDVA